MTPPAVPASPHAPFLGRRRRFDLQEKGVHALFLLCGFLSVFTTAAIILILAKECLVFLREVSAWEFLTGTRWAPLLEPRSFGVLPLLCGTLMIVVGSSLIAIPVGLATAVYLTEYASRRVRSAVKPILEILAGVPTVVYGFFALNSVTPLLREVFPRTEIFNAASAAIVVGVMILPVVASLCDDALRAVPASLRQAGYAMGATRFEVSTRIVTPAALSGVFAATILGMSRAFGETMAVTIAAGATPKMTFDFLEGIQTMTAYIVQVSLGDTPAGTIEYQTIFAVGGLLFLVTLAMNVLANRVMRRYQERYE